MEAIKFEGSAGHRLAGWIHGAAGEAWGAVTLAHCFTCTKDLHVVRRVADHLAEGGLTVLRFDFTGIGQSGGRLEETTLGHNVEDLRLALAALGRRVGPDLPLAVVGHSLGGTAALLAAPRADRVRGVAVIAAPADPARLGAMLGQEVRDRVQRDGRAEVTLGGRTFTISRAFLDSLELDGFEEAIGHLGRPLLVLQGDRDLEVRVADSERIFAAAARPKAYWPLPGADHLLSRREDAEQAARILTAWLRQWLGDPRGSY